jgi:hypothetical protein
VNIEKNPETGCNDIEIRYVQSSYLLFTRGSTKKKPE